MHSIVKHRVYTICYIEWTDLRRKKLDAMGSNVVGWDASWCSVCMDGIKCKSLLCNRMDVFSLHASNPIQYQNIHSQPKNRQICMHAHVHTLKTHMRIDVCTHVSAWCVLCIRHLLVVVYEPMLAIEIRFVAIDI